MVALLPQSLYTGCYLGHVSCIQKDLLGEEAMVGSRDGAIVIFQFNFKAIYTLHFSPGMLNNPLFKMTLWNQPANIL